jgi:hypothetical protein
MKRYKNKIALFLLAIYLPMWLLSSFHVHAYPLKAVDEIEEQHSSIMDEATTSATMATCLFHEEDKSCPFSS